MIDLLSAIRQCDQALEGHSRAGKLLALQVLAAQYSIDFGASVQADVSSTAEPAPDAQAAPDEDVAYVAAPARAARPRRKTKRAKAPKPSRSARAEHPKDGGPLHPSAAKVVLVLLSLDPQQTMTPSPLGKATDLEPAAAGWWLRKLMGDKMVEKVETSAGGWGYRLTKAGRYFPWNLPMTSARRTGAKTKQGRKTARPRPTKTTDENPKSTSATTPLMRVLVKLLENEDLNAATAEVKAGSPRSTVQWSLNQLYKRGLCTKTGKGRNVKYGRLGSRSA